MSGAESDLNWLQKLHRFGGYADVSVDDSSSPTYVQGGKQAAKLVALTGTLTAARTVILPLEAGADWVLKNATSGGYAVTVRGPTGAGVTVAGGTTAVAYCDGTDFIVGGAAPLGAAGGALTGTYPNPTIADGAITSAKIADGTIVDADVSATAAIAGSKVAPNFGAQAVETTGTCSVGGLTCTTLTVLQSAVAFSPSYAPTITQDPKQSSSASQAGQDVTWTAQAAVAGTNVAGAAAGGGFVFRTGLAARFTSGDAASGSYRIILDEPIGAGAAGAFVVTSMSPTLGDVIASFEYDGSDFRFRVVGAGIEYVGKCLAANGGTPNFGRAAVSMTADANHTVAAAHYAMHILTVTSTVVLTLPRDLILPLVDGAIYTVHNSTSGGQTLTVKGATGTGIAITNGSTARVYCDGTNYLQG